MIYKGLLPKQHIKYKTKQRNDYEKSIKLITGDTQFQGVKSSRSGKDVRSGELRT